MANTSQKPRIVLVGAGSLSFGLVTLADLLTYNSPALKEATVVLHDIDERGLELTHRVVSKAIEEAGTGQGGGLQLEKTTDPARALDGANYVVVSIEHGNRVQTWKQDYYVPIKHGSRQVYGENGGPGGAFHTWRQFPPLLKLVREMERHCPGAYLLNFSNPVPRLVWALNRTTNIRTIGLCHGIGSALRAIEEIFGTSRDNLAYTSAGLNHFYWFLEMKARTDLILPAIGGIPKKSVSAGDDLLEELRLRGLEWAEREEHMFLAELIRLYGRFTYPEESHPAEYVAWSDAYCPSVKYDFKALAQRGSQLRERLEASARGEETGHWWKRPSGERAAQIICGIEENSGQHEDAVNMQNNGTIASLRDDCVVEAPATVDSGGVHLQRIGELPRGIAQLLQKEVIVQEMVVEAAITGDYTTALYALTLDETVPNPRIARNILDEMLELQHDLLPQFRH